jgi:hypothetical protein
LIILYYTIDTLSCEEKNISVTREEISILKDELSAAQLERKNKMEYNEATLAISKFPTREKLTL